MSVDFESCVRSTESRLVFLEQLRQRRDVFLVQEVDFFFRRVLGFLHANWGSHCKQKKSTDMMKEKENARVFALALLQR